jgi:uncharacterized membrane protein YkvA (DUF1232 family)
MVSVDKDAVRAFGREVVMFLPDLVVLLRGVLADSRVPQAAKVEAGAALAYLVSPKNRLTNLIPIVGQLDDVAVVAFAFRRLVAGAEEPVLREHWRGSERALDALIRASTALATPAGTVRKAMLVKTLAGVAFDKVGGNGRGRRRANGPRIIDGEVINRADEKGSRNRDGAFPHR